MDRDGWFAIGVNVLFLAVTLVVGLIWGAQAAGIAFLAIFLVFGAFVGIRNVKKYGRTGF